MRTTLFVSLALFLLPGCPNDPATDAGVDAPMVLDAPVLDVPSTTDTPVSPEAGTDSGTDGGMPDAPSSVDAPDMGTDAPLPLDCARLPACEAAKGCGPILTEACCCDGAIFDPATAIGCCCGFGIVPGAMLTCEG